MASSTLREEPAKTHKGFFHKVGHYVKPAILPLLLALVPSLYHYSNNVEKLTLSSLYSMLVFNGILAIIVYVVCLAVTRLQPYKAAIASSIFLIFFNIYGLTFRYLLHLDLVRIRHYTFLPVMLLLAAYLIFFIARLRESIQVNIWKNLAIVVSVLVVFNLVRIIPPELKKWTSGPSSAAVSAASLQTEQAGTDRPRPDIYYIVFDEFSGLQPVRAYWPKEKGAVDAFAAFLRDRGFFVAEESHGSSKSTLRELATRLNYKSYPFETDETTYFNEIADNRAMRYLKSLGYTTVVIDETDLAYASARSIRADTFYNFWSSSFPQSKAVAQARGFTLDEFGELVMNNTMLDAIPTQYRSYSRQYKENDPVVIQHNNLITFATENVNDENVPSPKFVYVHLLLPHLPFIYTRNGEIASVEQFKNWNNYIETYLYTLKVAERMVNNIQNDADPANPPVIVLQSDHGVRNESANNQGVIYLENYPEQYKTWILNALYLPGLDTSKLSQDIDPINTFPIIFNTLFDAGIPLVN